MPPMRFGIFYEHQLPRPWDGGRRAEADLRRARPGRAGRPPRHRLRLGGRAPLPRGVLPLVGVRGVPRRGQPAHGAHPARASGSSQIPPGYQHPARVAEKVAMLDLVSDGPRRVRHRRDLARGPSSAASASTARPSASSGRRRSTSITRMFVEEPFAGYDGRFVPMPPRNVVPKPSQKPHPPLWVACSRRETIRLAAEKGIGALTFSFVEPEEAKEWVDEYYAIIASRGVRAGRLRGQPELRGRAADDVPRGRGDGDRARHRRRALLRLLARPLLRVRRPPPRAHERLGGVPAQPRRARLRARRSSRPTRRRSA